MMEDNLEAELKEFAKMEDGIKDIDWYRKNAEYAWAGGFLEGEGSFNLLKSSSPQRKDKAPYRNATMSAGQNHREPLERLKDLLGGEIYERKTGCKYQWVISGSKLQQAIPPVLPHLVKKREEAEVVLKYAQTIDPTRTRARDISDAEIKVRERAIDELEILRGREIPSKNLEELEEYYKAETEAARNGQEAAMAQAKLYKTGYFQVLEERDGLAEDVHRLGNWFVKALFMIVVAFFAGLLIGVWLYS